MLFPFAILYDLITRLRNFLYDKQVFKSITFPLPMINVGNLTVGGTGKTPHVEYLVYLLKNKNIAILSRGYGRKTKGYLDINGIPKHNISKKDISPQMIGDEPFQYFEKFEQNSNVRVYVGEKRANAIANILLSRPATQVIVLDDAFQHRAIAPNINLLLTDFGRLFYKDFLLPMGRLRESRIGAVRADAIIVSKCPQDFGDEKYSEMKNEIIFNIQKYTKENTPIFFSTIKYQAFENVFLVQKNLFENLLNGKENIKFYAVSGIAQPKIFLDYLAKNYDQKTLKNQLYEMVGTQSFADHHQYTETDVQNIVQNAKKQKANMIIVTEKDATKLQNQHFLPYLHDIILCKLPIGINFFEKTAFDTFILDKIFKFEN